MANGKSATPNIDQLFSDQPVVHTPNLDALFEGFATQLPEPKTKVEQILENQEQLDSQNKQLDDVVVSDPEKFNEVKKLRRDLENEPEQVQSAVLTQFLLSNVPAVSTDVYIEPIPPPLPPPQQQYLTAAPSERETERTKVSDEANAKSLMAIGDFSGAAELYEKALIKSSPNWQNIPIHQKSNKQINLEVAYNVATSRAEKRLELEKQHAKQQEYINKSAELLKQYEELYNKHLSSISKEQPGLSYEQIMNQAGNAAKSEMRGGSGVGRLMHSLTQYISGAIEVDPARLAEANFHTTKVEQFLLPLAGTVSSLYLIGGAIGGTVFAQTARLMRPGSAGGRFVRTLSRLTKGKVPEERFVNMISRSANASTNFGALETIRQVTSDLPLEEKVAAILTTAGFGAGLGAIGGGISQPAARITTEGAYGYLTSKLSGASDEESLLTAATFIAFSLMSRGNLRKADRAIALQRLHTTVVDGLTRINARHVAVPGRDALTPEQINYLANVMVDGASRTLRLDPKTGIADTDLNNVRKITDKVLREFEIIDAKARTGAQRRKEAADKRYELMPAEPPVTPTTGKGPAYAPQETVLKRGVPAVIPKEPTPKPATAAQPPPPRKAIELPSEKARLRGELEEVDRMLEFGGMVEGTPAHDQILAEKSDLEARIAGIEEQPVEPVEAPEVQVEPAVPEPAVPEPAVEPEPPKPAEVEPVEAPAEPPPKPTKGRMEMPVVYVKRPDIVVDEDTFQPREEINPEVIRSIKEDPDPTKVQPVLLWKNPEDGKTYLVAGHHTYYGLEEFAEIPARYMPEGTTRDQAQTTGYLENLQRTEQTDRDNLKVVRKLFNPDKSMAENTRNILDAAPGLGSTNKVANLVRLSFLNDGGGFIQNLENPGGFPRIRSYAYYVGQLRKNFPQITNTHETDIFDYLYQSGAANNPDNIAVQEHILSKIEAAAGADEFPARIDFTKELSTGLEARADTRELAKELREINKQILQIEEDLRINGVSMTDEERKSQAMRLGRLNEEKIAIQEGLGQVVERQEDIFGVSDVLDQYGLFGKPGETEKVYTMTEAQQAEQDEIAESRQQLQLEREYNDSQRGKIPEAQYFTTKAKIDKELKSLADRQENLDAKIGKLEKIRKAKQPQTGRIFEPTDPYGQEISPTFYSQAMNAVQTKFPDSMNALSVKNWLKKNQVKPEELEWLDIESFLKGRKKISREELLEFIQQNEITIEEVEKTGEVGRRYTPDDISETKKGWVNVGVDQYPVINRIISSRINLPMRTIKPDDGGPEDWAEVYQVSFNDGLYIYVPNYNYGYSEPGTPVRLVRRGDKGINKKHAESIATEYTMEHDLVYGGGGLSQDVTYENYTEPGGENYKELLLTLPTYTGVEANEFAEFQRLEKMGGDITPEDQARRTELFDKYGKIPKKTYTSPHFADKNILTWVRFKTRYDVDNNKVLFIEEIQSDWH